MNKPAVMPSMLTLFLDLKPRKAGYARVPWFPLTLACLTQVKQRSDILYDPLSQEVRE